MAVRQVKLPADERKNEKVEVLKLETDLIKELQHENLVQFLDSSLETSHLSSFTEFVAGGSAVALLRKYYLQGLRSQYQQI